jgi:O-antigen/teichoic acid export membrane protein
MLKSFFRLFREDGMLKDSSILLAGMIGAHFFNLLFQMMMGRCLAPDEFALLVMFLGIFNVFSVPLGVVSVTVSRFSSLLVKEGRLGDFRRLIWYWGGRMAAIGGVLSLLCFMFPEPIAGFLGLNRVAPIYIFGVTLVGIFCRPVVLGALLGLQCFGGWCLCNVFGAGMRVLVGTILVVFVSPFAGWGLLGNGVGFYAAILVGLVLLYTRLRGSSVSGKPLPDLRGYLLASFFILLGYSVLMTADVIFVKQRYPEVAGDFAYAATLARLVLLAPQALVGAMFPKVVGENRGTRSQLALFRKTMVATLLCAVAASIVFSLFARLFVHLIFNITEPSADLVRWLRLLSWVMVPVAVLNVPIRFALAQHRLWILSMVPFSALCYLVFVYLQAQGPDMVLYALGGISTVVLLVLSIWVGLFSRLSNDLDEKEMELR